MNQLINENESIRQTGHCILFLEKSYQNHCSNLENETYISGCWKSHWIVPIYVEVQKPPYVPESKFKDENSDGLQSL